MKKFRVGGQKWMKPVLDLRASSSDYHLRMLLWTRWGQQRAGWGPEAQVAGGGGKGLERRIKVLTVPKRKGGKQENWKCHRGQNSGKQGLNRTDVSQELGDESQGNRRNKRVRVGGRQWVPLGGQPAPQQCFQHLLGTGPRLVLPGLSRAVALNGLRYGGTSHVPFWSWNGN